jgi:hypothetical protein
VVVDTGWDFRQRCRRMLEDVAAVSVDAQWHGQRVVGTVCLRQAIRRRSSPGMQVVEAVRATAALGQADARPSPRTRAHSMTTTLVYEDYRGLVNDMGGGTAALVMGSNAFGSG